MAAGLHGDTAIAHAALEIWSRYAKGLPAKLGWPAMTTLATIIEFGIHGAATRGGAQATVEWPEIVDVVERAIKRLRPEEARIVRYEYTHSNPPELGARHCRVTLNHYRVLLHRARRAVGMYVAASSVALQQD